MRCRKQSSLPAMSDNDRVDAKTSSYTSSQLTKVQERLLYQQRDDAHQEIYRFIWVLAKRPVPYVMTVVLNPSGTGELTLRTTEPLGRLLTKDVRLVSQEQITELKAKLEAAHFWDAGPEDVNGFDGSDWVFEGLKHGRYNVVRRWSPASGPWRELGAWFLQIADRKPIGFY